METNTQKLMRYQYFYLVYLIVCFIYVGWLPTITSKFIATVLLAFFTIMVILGWSFNYKIRVFATIAQIFVMFFLAGFTSAGYFSLLFYPSAMIGTLKGKHMTMGLVCFLTTGYIEIAILFSQHPLAWLDSWPMVLSGTFAVIGSAYGTRSSYTIIKAKNDMEKANAEIERLTQIAERERISQDLHDVMGHQLSMITLKAQLAKRVLERDKNVNRALTEITDMETAAREALSRVREYISNIRQPDFNEEWLAAIKLLQTAGLQITYDHQAHLRVTDKSYQTMAMCLRELSTNIVRHSHATSARLEIKEINDSAYMLVADDGIGLQNALLALKEGTNTGNGINGVLARMNTIDGKVAFWNHGQLINQADVSSPFHIPFARGTAVLLFAPIATRREITSGLEALL